MMVNNDGEQQRSGAGQRKGHGSAMNPMDIVKRYHEQTKHEFDRYARSAGYLDWANQPDPFRRYTGAPLHHLPRLSAEDDPTSPSYASLHATTSVAPRPLTWNSLSRFFEYSLSITAWKEYGGNRWALRSNPSSGNLHPTEGYLLIDTVAGLPLQPGLYHYAPKEHALEHRMHGASTWMEALLRPFPPHSFLVGLSSIHWREAWKYGERAFRYCQHDSGHAIGTLRIAGAALGWRVVLLSGLDDQAVGAILGLNRVQEFEDAEPEWPELICVVFPARDAGLLSMPLTLAQTAIAQCVQGNWHGQATRLSRDAPVLWEIIDDVTSASWKHTTEPSVMQQVIPPPPARETGRGEEHVKPSNGKSRDTDPAGISAHQLIHQRRSAVAFDGNTSITAAQFFAMLDRIFPRADLPVAQRPMPWDAISWDPTIHLALFVHRVEGLTPGIYMFLRHTDPLLKDTLQRFMHPQFTWTIPEHRPASLPLYRLEDGDARRLAIQLSCHQEIAGASSFSLGMVAEFDASLAKYGPWFYKRLFWETGVIGQILYLEAEAAGVRATGIGCFFDDPVHRVLGWYPHTHWQSLYHFTVGGPVEDRRLTTLPPYRD